MTYSCTCVAWQANRGKAGSSKWSGSYSRIQTVIHSLNPFARLSLCAAMCVCPCISAYWGNSTTICQWHCRFVRFEIDFVCKFHSSASHHITSLRMAGERCPGSNQTHSIVSISRAAATPRYATPHHFVDTRFAFCSTLQRALLNTLVHQTDWNEVYKSFYGYAANILLAAAFCCSTWRLHFCCCSDNFSNLQRLFITYIYAPIY